MREIKFRARNAGLPKCWIYGYFIIENGHNFIVNEDGKFKVIADTEGQYTGLKDKNGKKIYEGDIQSIEFFNDNTQSFDEKYASVVFGGGRFYLREIKGERSCSINEFREVIGNIDETPELSR